MNQTTQPGGPPRAGMSSPIMRRLLIAEAQRKARERCAAASLPSPHGRAAGGEDRVSACATPAPRPGILARLRAWLAG